MGLEGLTNLCLKSFFCHCVQLVEINQIDDRNNKQNTYTCSFREIIPEMPQVSILGPHSFLLYINDLPLNMQEAKMVLLADDINILVVDKNKDTFQEKINKVMKRLEIRFQENNLLIRSQKTVVILFKFNKIRLADRRHTVFINSEIAYSS